MTQFKTLLNYYLTGKSISQTEAYMIGISGSSFHRLNGEIERKYGIPLVRTQKGEGQGFYYSYSMRWEDMNFIKYEIKKKNINKLIYLNDERKQSIKCR
jgi:hypothetical protein